MRGLNDTDPEAERVLLELMGQASPARRLALAFSLSRTVMGLSIRGLARGSPEDGSREVELRFVEIHYGAELAQQVRTRLAAGPR